jgi:mannose-1-phosphate guanylyltransferase/mannose-6-phosphate isomerase
LISGEEKEMRKSVNFKAVILAGGSGERFWPLSTPSNPKQFLRVFGGESLIRQSISRLHGLLDFKDIFVVTSRALVATTRKELPEIPRENIIGEPMRRDTGAAVALGVGAAGDGVLGFFSSDQMVSNPKEFKKTIKRAIIIASKKKNFVTIGIKPTFPSADFGYVNPQTGTFVEKPNIATAKKYLKKGYLWNAGMFIADADVFREAFAVHQPELLQLAKSIPSKLKSVYENLPRISFDYAVMEKVKNISVVPGDFGWDDVGGFAAFDKYFPHDSKGNVREGPCTVVDSNDNICVARSARISLLGVKGLVVVTTHDSVLVADKSCISEMKKLLKTK